jgi:hypothetical protein
VRERKKEEEGVNYMMISVIFCCPSYIINVIKSRVMMDWTRSSTRGDIRSAGKPEGYRSLVRFRYR